MKIATLHAFEYRSHAATQPSPLPLNTRIQNSARAVIPPSPKPTGKTAWAVLSPRRGPKFSSRISRKTTAITTRPSDTHYQMLNRNGVLIQRRYQLGFEGKETNVDEKQIDYIVGSGNHMRTYVHRNADGTLLELPLAWYAEKGGYWAMNPGYDAPDYPYARRQIAYDCMFCHNAYPKTPAGHDRLGDRPVYSGNLPEGIDCQRCHGPGQRHIDIASTPGSKPDADSRRHRESRAPGQRPALEVCAQCHLKTTEFRLPHAIKRYERPDFSYRPGEPLASICARLRRSAGTAKRIAASKPPARSRGCARRSAF